ncbi:hypothetical protein WJX79_005251 [Trebouxia sp. C0005]
MEPKPKMITFTRKKQAPQVILDRKSHTQGGRTKLVFTTEVAARMPTAFLAPPASHEHTGPDQLLQLSKIPVAGSSQHLISNKKTLASQQDKTALPPPVTVPSKRLTKVITPLTHPEDRSSDSGSSWSIPSSSGASSYQPSSNSSRREEEAKYVINAQAGQPAAAKQATEFPNVLDRCAGKPPAYQAKSTVLQLPAATSKGTADIVQGKQGADQAKGSAAPAAKRQRTGKAVLNEADMHVTSAAVKGAANNDTIVVEMPPDFDIAGDAGSIGRFALQPRNSREAMQMDIKGSLYDTRHVSCSSSLLLVKVANTGGGGSASVEMATNVYVQASTVQTGPEHADCTKEWSDEENEYFEPPAAPNLKAKVPKPKAKRKLRTKAAAKMK